jgi:hypothetical protein
MEAACRRPLDVGGLAPDDPVRVTLTGAELAILDPLARQVTGARY